MAVTLHALEEEETYTRLRFCACCPLAPAASSGPGGSHITGTKARLRRVLSHVGDGEWSAPPELGAGSGLPGAGRLLRSRGATMEIPWCRDVTPPKPPGSEGTGTAAAVTPVPVAAAAATAAARGAALRPGVAEAQAVIAGLEAELEALSMDIWKNPELNYRETYACAAITTFLEERGVTVEVGYCGLPTALRAEFSAGEGPTIAFCAEYDALPEIGHACGHNLIAMAGVGGFLGAKAALERGLISGTAVLLGTPAEEAGGGKIDLIEAGAFDAIDCAMMTHPTPVDLLYPPVLAIQEVVIAIGETVILLTLSLHHY